MTAETAASAPKSDRRPDEFKLLFRPIRFAFWLFFKLMGGFTVHGAENLPAKGGVIVAANHTSFADPPLITNCMRRPLRFFAKVELFKVPIFGPLIRHLGAFPVIRGTPDRAAIRQAIGILENGEVLLIFPEGNRGDGVTLGTPEKGISLIAVRSGAPIIPVYIEGAHKMLPSGRSTARRAHLTATFGKPIDSAAFKGRGEELGTAIMDAIAALRDEQATSASG